MGLRQLPGNILAGPLLAELCRRHLARGRVEKTEFVVFATKLIQ